MAYELPSAPEKNVYCDIHGQAPAEFAKKRGYAQYALSVTNSIAAPIEGLNEGEFSVWEARKSLPVAYFSNSGEPMPVSLAIVVET